MAPQKTQRLLQAEMVEVEGREIPEPYSLKPQPRKGLGFRVQGSGFRVQGSGFRV